MTTEILEPEVQEVSQDLSLDLRVSKEFNAELSKLNISEDELRADAEKALALVITGVDDKAGWKAADEQRKNLKVKRVNIKKIGKYIRDEANKFSKKVIAREEELVGLIDEAETYLDKRQKEIQAERDAIKKREDDKKNEIFSMRVAALTRFGVLFTGNTFVLDERVFQASDVRDASDDLYEKVVLIPCREAFEKKEALRIAEEYRLEEERKQAEAVRVEAERLRMEAEQKLADERAEMERKQEEFRKQQAEFEEKRREAERIEEEKRQQERLSAQAEEEKARKAEWEKQKAIEIEERERIAAENAATKERERIEANQRAIEEEQRRQEAEKAEKLAAASDKEKWTAFVVALTTLRVPEMRSGQYRKKSAIAREKQEEILSL